MIPALWISKTGLDAQQIIVADVNKDGKITPTDAASILSYYAYISTTTDEIIMTIEEFLTQ